MNIEKKRIESWNTGKGSIGHITLDKLAIPETVKVTLLGEPVIPESFDCYGHPNFTKEQETLYMLREEELKRQNGREYDPLKAEIVYEERIFDVPTYSFNTVYGIEHSLLSLSDLNEMLQNRRIFCQAYKNEKLSKFMLFGCYILGESGQIKSVDKTAKGKLKTDGDVEELETFFRRNGCSIYTPPYGYAIPTAGSVCPCCGKTLTIDDVKNNPCVYINGKFYHDSCWLNYRKLIAVDKFTRQMIKLLYYKSTDYNFELLPNSYCNQDCDHIFTTPWILFHTIDGDIIMGLRMGFILIEWQENYKPFDMDKIFGNEDVIKKLEKDGKRGIYALGEDKAYEYLKKVVKTVNPSYSKW